mgnify:CR=1 FL=1
MQSPVLAVDGLAVDIRGAAVLGGVSLEIAAGQALGLVGESGCGKSMTALAILGLLPRGAQVRAGSVRLQGQELLTWKITAWFLDDAIRQGEKEYSRYRINQISGSTVDIPQFLTDAHVIKSRRSAERYLSRLTEFGRVLRESEARVVDDRAHGVVPPDFVIAQTLVGMRAFIDGGAEKNALVTTL